jgi:hypothetical protein
MKNKSSIGMNRTGLQMSPLDSKDLIAAARASVTDTPYAALSPEDLRGAYIAEAEPLGTVPPPGTLKGAAKSAVQMVKGIRPQGLLDKLGERLAFERGGARLYEAFMVKCQQFPNAHVDMDRVQHFHDEEVQHFMMVANAIEMLGGDPTAQTPAADLVGIEAQGLMQAMADPRTSVAQSLHVLLTAELTDNAGWELLITLAREAGQDELASHFTRALQEENEHLNAVRAWHAKYAMDDLRQAA